eukprot:scaffold259_cov252-Pinguiococcus_pyrenoidosus.AAC.31
MDITASSRSNKDKAMYEWPHRTPPPPHTVDKPSTPRDAVAFQAPQSSGASAIRRSDGSYSAVS